MKTYFIVLAISVVVVGILIYLSYNAYVPSQARDIKKSEIIGIPQEWKFDNGVRCYTYYGYNGSGISCVVVEE